MTSHPIYQIDAFTQEVFKGNPAAVCPLESWPADSWLQAVAAENNLSETAFFVRKDDIFHLRWFTPRHEVDLCGHATLAAAFVIFTELGYRRTLIHFETRSGPLGVTQRDGLITMDFPVLGAEEDVKPPDPLLQGLGVKPESVYRVDDDPNWIAVFNSEDSIRRLSPDMSLLARLHPYGVVVTAPGSESDCVSRYFAPSYGIPEDPVTGSIHCALAPYWAERLGKTKIQARQSSERGGSLCCELKGNRVMISGHAVKYMEGAIILKDPKEEFHIVPFEKAAAEEVIALLSSADLPTEDLNHRKFETFILAKDRDGSVVGTVGMEVCSKAALLRSLAVQSSLRGKGVGRRLVKAIESAARKRGVQALYLLTLTASNFFKRMDYQNTEREKVPEAIAMTDEFKGICPASSPCMSKQISHS